MFQKQSVIEAETAQESQAQVGGISRFSYQSCEERCSAGGHASDGRPDTGLEAGQVHEELTQLNLLKLSEGSGNTKARASAARTENKAPRKIVVRFVVIGAVMGGMTAVALSPGDRKIRIAQRPSMAEQMALTSGYRAMQYNPATYSQ